MSFASVTASGLRRLGRTLRGSRRSHQRGQPSSCGQQLLGGFRHVLLLHVRHPVGCFIADGLPHGFKNTRLGDAAQIGPHRWPPVDGHIERDGFRQFVGRCPGARPSCSDADDA